MQASLL